MPYIKRSASGDIEAISQTPQAGFDEQLDSNNSELLQFVQTISAGQDKLAETDLAFVRVTEDLVELLIAKNLICFTDLPEVAQQKILQRQKLRSELENSLDLISDDNDQGLAL